MARSVGNIYIYIFTRLRFTAKYNAYTFLSRELSESNLILGLLHCQQSVDGGRFIQ